MGRNLQQKMAEFVRSLRLLKRVFMLTRQYRSPNTTPVPLWRKNAIFG